MKIGIHHRKGSFSERWLEYTQEHDTPVKIVDCYRSDIVDQLADCEGLMWHWAHHDHRAALFARQLTFALEAAGKHVFPDSSTCWHYDDKLGQKYLLEAVGVPLVPSYVFYDEGQAIAWAEQSDFPKVFKLRGGAGSTNVWLVNSRPEAIRLIRRAFGRGFGPINRFSVFRDKMSLVSRHRTLTAWKECFRAMALCLVPGRLEKRFPREKNYAYFQDFIADNSYDTRLVVIGDRCFGVKRHCRKGDFRASGSGLLEYDPALFDRAAIEAAFATAGKLGAQSLAFDLLRDANSRPRINEISYAFPTGPFLEACPGYWDRQLNWVPKTVKPAHCMVEDFVVSINVSTKRVSKRQCDE